MKKVTEAHPNKYYLERIDVCDNALIRYFLLRWGRGHFSTVKSHGDRWPLFCEKSYPPNETMSSPGLSKVRK